MEFRKQRKRQPNKYKYKFYVPGEHIDPSQRVVTFIRHGEGTHNVYRALIQKTIDDIVANTENVHSIATTSILRDIPWMSEYATNPPPELIPLIDPRLTDRGIVDAKRARVHIDGIKEFLGEPIVYVSPLMRAQQTAYIALTGCDIFETDPFNKWLNTVPRITNGCTEIFSDKGGGRGNIYDRVAGRSAIESIPKLIIRAGEFVRAVTNSKHSGKHVIVASHSEFLFAVLQGVLELDSDQTSDRQSCDWYDTGEARTFVIRR